MDIAFLFFSAPILVTAEENVLIMNSIKSLGYLVSLHNDSVEIGVYLWNIVLVLCLDNLDLLIEAYSL